MENRIYRRLVDLIQHYSSWIELEAPEVLWEFSCPSGGVLKTGLFRAMVLVCRHSKYGNAVGRQWVIPEFDLDRAVHALKGDDEAFHRRLRRAKLTLEDANRILHQASYGLLSIDLEEW